MRVFENRVLRRIFEPKRDEVRQGWSRIYKEELNDMYSSPNTIRVIKSRRTRWARKVSRTGARIGGYRVSMGKPEGKRPLGRPRRKWEDNIKIGLQEEGFCGHGPDLSGSGKEQVAGTCDCGNELSSSIKRGEIPDS